MCTEQVARRHLGHQEATGYTAFPPAKDGAEVVSSVRAGRLGWAQEVGPILPVRTLGWGLNSPAEKRLSLSVP